MNKRALILVGIGMTILGVISFFLSMQDSKQSAAILKDDRAGTVLKDSAATNAAENMGGLYDPELNQLSGPESTVYVPRNNP